MAALVLSTKTSSSRRTVWVIGENMYSTFGIGDNCFPEHLIKCDWSDKIQIKNIYVSSDYVIVEDTDGNHYSAGNNINGACTVNDTSYENEIVNVTPITYFKQNNIKILQVFVSNNGDAPWWKAEDG
eukprot:96236_1